MRNIVQLLVLVLFVSGIPVSASSPSDSQRFSALIFSKTAGFRHASIPNGIVALERLAEEHNFSMSATEDASAFEPENLSRYDVVVFLNTTGTVFDESQRNAFQAFIQGGGGFVGIHSAADTEYDWPWYGELVGAYFDSHPRPQEADVLVVDRRHPSTRDLPARWQRFDEWYNYRASPRDDVHVLMKLDTRSYEGSNMGDDHPIAWAHNYDGGRAWYTGLGHTEEGYSDPPFLQHLLGGIEWAAGVVPADVGATQTSSFEKVILTEDVTDPMELGITRDGRVFIAERQGAIKMWDPETKETRLVAHIPVRMTIEDGMQGLTLDPDFDENGWIYLYYAPADGARHRLSRFTFDGEQIDIYSEAVLLEIFNQKERCCHTAGSLTFDADGNLYLSTGDNSGGGGGQSSPMDNRPGGRFGDSRRTSANTNDLRGKILRIRPLPDGTYEIPEGNLFPEESPLTRPEIYTMGHRNPYRISVDPKTGYLFWGNVGAGYAANEDRPTGWDDFDRARGPGFFGWPLIVGPREPNRAFDYVTQTLGDYYDPDRPINDSPNNTGLRVLPPSQGSLIWYTYGVSEQWPQLGAGGLNPMAGPVYRYDAETVGPRGLPEYYEGKWFIYEWARNWVQVVTFDENEDVLDISPFAPGFTFIRPMDMEVGHDGRLYVAEWGDTFWGSNPDAQIVRIDYYGSPERHTPSVTAADSLSSSSSSSSGRALSISWPPDGGIFDFDEDLEYRVEGAEGDDVIVQPYIGFDTHALPLDPVEGSEGTLTVTYSYPHNPDQPFMNRFARLDARVDGGSGSAGETASVLLQPRIKEAEHFSSFEGAVRHIYGIHPAARGYAATALTVMRARDGNTISYAPVNLVNIDSLTFRVKQVAPGTIEVRLGAPDGPLLAAADLDANPTRMLDAKQKEWITAYVETGIIPRMPAMTPYEGWSEVSVPIEDPGGTHELFLVFRSEADGNFVELDWMRFAGPGVMPAGE